MIIKVTRKYIKGSRKGIINENNYNMNNWEESVAWAISSSNDDTIPFVILEIKNDYGQHKTFEY